MHDRLCGFEEVVWATGVRTVVRPCTCGLIAAVRADEREKLGASMAALMRKHPYEYPSDYADMTERMIADGSIHDAARGGEQDA